MTSGIGELPRASTFNPWRMAAVEMLVEQLRSDGMPVPRELLTELADLSGALAEETEVDDDAEPPGPFAMTPEFQVLAARRCLQLRPLIEAGDGAAVMEAVAFCAARGLMVPGWLAAAFVVRNEAVSLGLARSWDDPLAFGPALPKGTNVAGIQAEKVLAPKAYEAATRQLAADPSAGLDKGFYEQLGASIGFGATRAEQLVRMHVSASDGSCPPLAKLKAFLRSGLSLSEALHRWTDLRAWRLWCSAGGTWEQWRATFDEDPPVHPES